MVRVLLVYPKPNMGLMENIGVVWPPIWLIHLATTIKAEVEIFDFRVDHNFPKVLAKGFDYVGFSVHTSDLYSTIVTAKYVKINSKAKVVFGGPHPTALPESIPDIVDYVIVGDGEKGFQSLLNDSKDRIIRENGIIDVVPDYSLINMKKYGQGTLTSMNYPSYGVFTARGCPYHCSFCSTRSYKPINHDIVFEHIDILINYGMKDCKILDGSFTVNRKRTIEFCKRVKKYNITWNCQARIDDLDDELLNIMAGAGCTSIGVGIESGDTELRGLIGKSKDLTIVKKRIRQMEKYGIESRVCFMFGFLEDTPQSMQKTLEVAKKLNADYTHFSILTPFPGTEFYNDLVQKEIVMSDDYNKYDTYRLVFKHPVLSEKQIKTFIKKAYREVYLTPAYITKRIRKFARTPIHESKVLWDGVRAWVSFI